MFGCMDKFYFQDEGGWQESSICIALQITQPLQYQPLQCVASMHQPCHPWKRASRSESNAHHPHCTCSHIRYHSQNAQSSSRSDLLRCCISTSRSLHLTAILVISKSSRMDPVFRAMVALGGSSRWGAGKSHHLEGKM